ncbi:MAG: 30S ribosomal protein S20 [Spirochaetales bacterium]
MANIKSAKKRIKVIARRHEENRGKKTELTTAMKKFRAMVTAKELAQAKAFLPNLVALVDEACSAGRLHANNASRKKSRLASMLYKAEQEANVAPVEEPKVEVKVEEVKVEEVVAEVKKAPAKKTAAPKTETAAKKAPAKKKEA